MATGPLQLKAQEDVQVVGHFVGLGADQRRLDFVDRKVENLQGYALEYGKDFLSPLIEEPPEPQGAPHQVFP